MQLHIVVYTLALYLAHAHSTYFWRYEDTGHSIESLLRPREEPVNAGIVDQTCGKMKARQATIKTSDTVLPWKQTPCKHGEPPSEISALLVQGIADLGSSYTWF